MSQSSPRPSNDDAASATSSTSGTYQPRHLSVTDLNQAQSAQSTKKKKSLPRILESYFTVKSNKDGQVEANCNACGKSIKGNITSTSNFRSHLQVLHEHWEKYMKAKFYTLSSFKNERNRKYGSKKSR